MRCLKRKLKKPKNDNPITAANRRAMMEAQGLVHDKISEDEKDNSGVEAAHRTEEAGEAVIVHARNIKQGVQAKRSNKVAALEKKQFKAEVNFRYQKYLEENPEVKKKAIQKRLQKQRIKREYAKALKKGTTEAKQAAGYAKKAATYFLSYMFCYNAIYDENSEFSKLGYKTAGGTAVSVEHQCIDPYASVIVPDLLRLYAIDGNEMWKKAAQLIWNNCTQCIAGKNGLDLHGMHRLPGMQNECFAQSRWTKYRSSPEMRGHLNDFLGIWLSDFRLYAIDGMEKLDIELE